MEKKWQKVDRGLHLDARFRRKLEHCQLRHSNRIWPRNLRHASYRRRRRIRCVAREAYTAGLAVNVMTRFAFPISIGDRWYGFSASVSSFPALFPNQSPAFNHDQSLDTQYQLTTPLAQSWTILDRSSLLTAGVYLETVDSVMLDQS